MQGIKKKLVAALTVVALVVSALATALPAYAAGENASLTVSGHVELAGKNVSAVKMFSASKNGDSVAYTLDRAWENFFKELEDGNMSSLTGDELSEAAIAYVRSLGDDATGTEPTTLTQFAEKAKDYVAQNSSSFTIHTSSEPAAVSSDGATASATINNLEYGYYLVYPESGSTSDTRLTDATLMNVLDQQVTWNIKSEYPTVDKTITNIQSPEGGIGIDIDDSWDGNHDMGLESLALDNPTSGASANVGDIITFQLTSNVPDMSDYANYTFKLHDTLSKGLTLITDPANAYVEVKIGDTTLTQGTDFNVSASGEDGASLTIDLSSYLTKHKNDPGFVGKAIVATYKAELNDQASVFDPNTNSAKVEYSNNPSTGGTGESTDDKTYTYTFGFTIDKRAEIATGDSLAGAEFKIYADTDGDGVWGSSDAALKFSAGTGDNAGNYMYDPEGSLDTVTTGTDGKLNFYGLAEGTYFVEEVNVPKPYNKLADKIVVKIEAEYYEDNNLEGHDEGQLKSYSISYKMPSDTEWTQISQPNHTIVVVNKSGAELPGTGGMGTVIFTVVGVAVVAGGAIWMAQRNRRSAAHNGSHMA